MNIVLTGTRATLVAVVLILLINSFKSIKQALVTSLILLLLAMVLNMFFNVQEVLTDTQREYSVESPRLYYILKGFEVWKESPLFGIGFNTYGTEHYREITGDIIFSKFNIHGFDWANLSTTDTFFAQIIPEFGIVGITLLLMFSVYIYKNYRNINKIDRSNKAYLYIILSCLILSVNSSGVLFNAHVGSLFWISIGMIMSNYIRLKETGKNKVAG